MHELIVSPFMADYLVLRPGFRKGVKVSHRKYRELGHAVSAGGVCPTWLADVARRVWKLEISGRVLSEVFIVRGQTSYG